MKKVLLADVLGQYVDAVWTDMGLYPSGNVLWRSTPTRSRSTSTSRATPTSRSAFRLFGSTLPENFDRPYLAQSPREFWQRWHMSLSTWLRDYLYVSLGGNRVSPVRTYVNLLITMVLGGLWHGAAWTFVVWGAYHGVLLAVHRFVSPPGSAPVRGRLVTVAARVGTFHLIVLGWVFFRAPSLLDGMHALSRLGVSGWVTTEAPARRPSWSWSRCSYTSGPTLAACASDS
jgi:hypothetical protein